MLMTLAMALAALDADQTGPVSPARRPSVEQSPQPARPVASLTGNPSPPGTPHLMGDWGGMRTALEARASPRRSTIEAKIGRLSIGEDFAAAPCFFQSLYFCGPISGHVAPAYCYNPPVSIAQRWARIINIASVAGDTPGR